MPPMSRPDLVKRRVSMAAFLVVAGLASAAPVAAHGPVPDEPPSAATLLLGWTFPPLPTLAILVAIVWWAYAPARRDRFEKDGLMPFDGEDQ